jgi:hypothetical protein
MGFVIRLGLRFRSWWSGRCPPAVRAAFVIAALFLGGGAVWLGERAYVWGSSELVEGTVIGHEPYGNSKAPWPVVEYEWLGQRYQWQPPGPMPGPIALRNGDEALPVGSRIGVYVPPQQPSQGRLAIRSQWLFLPTLFCLFPGTLFLLSVLAALVWGRPQVEPAAASACIGVT